MTRSIAEISGFLSAGRTFIYGWLFIVSTGCVSSFSSATGCTLLPSDYECMLLCHGEVDVPCPCFFVVDVITLVEGLVREAAMTRLSQIN